MITGGCICLLESARTSLTIPSPLNKHEMWRYSVPVLLVPLLFLSSPPCSIPFSFQHIPLFSSFIFLSGDPPWSFLLDKFNTADVGACLKHHIDPPFFKVESVSSGIVKSQA